MRKLLVLSFLLLLAPFARAGQTVVTATITAPNGQPYAAGSGRGSIVCPGNQAPTINGFTVPRTITITTFNGFGAFMQTFYDTNTLDQPGCGYQFAITDQTTLASFTTPTLFTVTGAAVNLSTQISSYSVPLPVTSGGASISGSNCEPAYLSTTMDLLNTHAPYFYAECYGNSDPGANITACITAASAVNGTCDTTFYSGTATMAQGDHFFCGASATQAPVTIIVPMDTTWNMSAAASSGLNMLDIYPPCVIFGYGGVNNLQLVNNSATAGAFNAGIVIHPNAAANGRVNVSGIGVVQHSLIVSTVETHSFASGVGYLVNSMVDNSVLFQPTSFDSSTTDTCAMEFIATNSLGYSASVYNGQTDVNSKGQIPLCIEGSGSLVGLSGLNFWGGTWGHPGVGFPNIRIHDSNATKLLDQNFMGDTYLEGNQTTPGGDTTTQAITIDGARAVHFDHVHVASFQTPRTSPGIVVTNAYPTVLTIGSISLQGFPGFTWTLPAVAVQNANDGNVSTDGNGLYGNYVSSASFSQGVTSYRTGNANTNLIQYTLATSTVSTTLSTQDNGSGGNIYQQDCIGLTAGQNCQFEFGRNTTTGGGTTLFQVFKGDGSGSVNSQFLGNGNSSVQLLTGCFSVGHNSNCGGHVFAVGPTDQFSVDNAGIAYFAGSTSGNATVKASATGSDLVLNGVGTIDTAGNLAVTTCTGCGVTSGVSEATWGAGQITNMAANGVWGETVLPSNHTLVRLTVFVTTAAVACTTYPQFTITDVTTSTPLASITLTSGVSFTDSGALSVAMTGGDTIEIAVTRAYNTCGTSPLDASVTAVYK